MSKAENTTVTLEELLVSSRRGDACQQMIIVSGGGGFSASATTGPTSPGIDDNELGDARDLGKRVAEVASVIKRGTK